MFYNSFIFMIFVLFKLCLLKVNIPKFTMLFFHFLLFYINYIYIIFNSMYINSFFFDSLITTRCWNLFKIFYLVPLFKAKFHFCVQCSGNPIVSGCWDIKRIVRFSNRIGKNWIWLACFQIWIEYRLVLIYTTLNTLGLVLQCSKWYKYLLFSLRFFAF